MTLRVLHLIGSAVSHFHVDLSRLYAGDCLRATADPEQYEFLIAYVTPDGRWRFPADLEPASIEAARPMTLADAVRTLDALAIDVVVPQMFCLPGMTTYRALFGLLGIPYVGNRPEVMALAAHKGRAKAVVAAAGVRVPQGQLVCPGDAVTIDLPVVVKPVDSDNSLGLTMVRDWSDLDGAVADACAHGSAALVETYVELGREVRCGIVVRDGELVCLPLEEYAVDSAAKPIRDRDDKLARDSDGELRLVAKESTRAWLVDVDDPVTAKVWEAARRCHEAIGARHYSLFDFRIDPDGEPWFLEAGLYNSFARQSVVTMMAAAAGMPVEQIFRMAVDQALG